MQCEGCFASFFAFCVMLSRLQLPRHATICELRSDHVTVKLGLRRAVCSTLACTAEQSCSRMHACSHRRYVCTCATKRAKLLRANAVADQRLYASVLSFTDTST
eukprot:6184720-Pleurochrysis_carterae.AAC.3